MFSVSLLDLPKMALSAAAGFLACYIIASLWWLPQARSDERDAARLAAAHAALERIEIMEKNNADFLALPDRQRCLVFMRDSGLPESECGK